MTEEEKNSIVNPSLSGIRLYMKHMVVNLSYKIINRPREAGAVLRTPLSLINSLIQTQSHPFPPNLQNIINPLELGT